MPETSSDVSAARKSTRVAAAAATARTPMMAAATARRVGSRGGPPAWKRRSAIGFATPFADDATPGLPLTTRAPAGPSLARRSHGFR